MKFEILKSIPINPQVFNLASSYWQWRYLWIVSTVAFCGLGLTYAVLFKKDYWVASQALIVRDEATGAVMRLGRFESQSQMKAAQETVLEMARNPQVVAAALQEVGRPASFFGFFQNTEPPTKSEIEDFAKNFVSVRAPRGSELGTTEVIYLDVKQDSQQRAIQLTSAICDALEKQLKFVRVERAVGVIAELEAAKSVCEAGLAHATTELQNVEVEAGSDLPDLRGLTESSAGGTNRFLLDMVRDELRKTDLKIKTITPDVQLARAALENSDLLLQAADVLSESHPVVANIRRSLSETMVKTATLEGRYTQSHPLVMNSRSAEAALQQNIRDELRRIVDGYEAALANTQQKIRALNAQEQELGQRLNRLAELRGKYSNLTAEVKSRGEKLSQIRNELTETVAARDAAQAASLLTRLDSPVLGEKPVGPGRTTIVGGATVGGLMFGLGVVFLLVPLDGAKTPPNSSQGISYSELVRGRREERNGTKVAYEASSGTLSELPLQPAPDTSVTDNQARTDGSKLNEPATSVGRSNSKSNTPDPADVPSFASGPLKAVDLAIAKAASNIQGVSTGKSSDQAAKASADPSTGRSSNAESVTTVESAIADRDPQSSQITPAKAQPQKPRRVDSIDDVRNLISNALKNHNTGDNT